MSTPKLSITTELMKNYKQSELMSPEKKFEALQTNTGCSLLFSIGTDNIFYVTQEDVTSGTGWVKTDLSSAQIAKSFSKQPILPCSTFEAAQSIVDGTIGLGMAVNDTNNDYLFLCLGNSNTNTDWTKSPNWIAYPFDNPNNPPKTVKIVNILISETANQTQYIVVDILRDPSSAEKLISRYYIDTSNTGGYAWHAHDVSIDLEADSYSSCLGRQYLTKSPHQPTIDGLYTIGQVDGNPQFVFQPLYNVFNPSIPAPSARLNLPGNIIAESVASCRKPDMSTDLYACSNGGLYYFASSNQNDGAVGVLLLQNIMFLGVKKMYAFQMNDTVIVWGLNATDQIFYVTCPVGHELNGAWSYPLPILSNVDLFSPYINCVNSGNTFFAVAENTLSKVTKSTEDGTWSTQSITLPSLNTKDTQKYSSYTTRIQVTDENNQLLVNTPISIGANTRTGVYINHLYYILDATPIQINSDQLGSITIVEWITDLTGTKLNISAAGVNPTILNPMDSPFQKVTQLNTVDSLRNATITNADGSKRPLVSNSISQSDLQAVATANGNLANVYKTVINNNQSLRALRLNTNLRTSNTLQLNGIDAILVDAGDLFKWLASGIEAVIQIIEDAASKVWHFVATIAGKVYASVLDCVEKVVGAVVWVFNMIKTAIEDLIQFLEFLFEWEDIMVTHRVMKNVFIQFAQNSINSLSGYKTDITAVFTAMQNDVNKWANIPSFNQTPGSTTGSNKELAGQNSSPANLGIHHFQGNATGSSSSFNPLPVADAIFKDLLTLLDSEETTLMAAYNAIKTDIIDQFDSLSVAEIIQKFIAIVVDTLLQTAENILLAVVDVFIQLTQGMLDLFTETIDIPVISWLYKEITGDELSFLDLVCLISAIPTTIIYKIGAGKAPFPKGDAFTQGLLNATNFQQIQSLFFTTSSPAKSTKKLTALAALADEPVLDESRLKTFGFVTGIFALAGSIVLVITTTIQRAFDIFEAENPFAKTVALVAAIGNTAYVSPNIATFINAKTDNWYQQMNNVLTGISIVKGFVNIPLSTIDSKSPVSKISPAVESLINVVWNVPVIMNIIDNKDRWDTNYKSLIPESIGNFAFNVGGIMELPITLTKDPDSKAIASLVQFGLMLVYGICMPIAGGIYQWAPDQKHS